MVKKCYVVVKQKKSKIFAGQQLPYYPGLRANFPWYPYLQKGLALSPIFSHNGTGGWRGGR
jgi:hypothetical protein